MAAKYDFFPTPMRKDETEMKYHARLVTDGKLTTKDIARKIASRCSIKESDVIGVFIGLEDILCKSLSEGEIVQLDGIGSFRISVKSPAVKDKHEVRAESIAFKNIVYTPEKKLLGKLSSTRFERVKFSHCSAELSGIEIDGLLTEYFKDHEYITTQAMRIELFYCLAPITGTGEGRASEASGVSSFAVLFPGAGTFWSEP